MPVYKAYFKIVKKNLPIISVYVLVFLLITIPLTHFYSKKTSSVFQPTRINIVLINEESAAPLSQGLQNYLERNANIIDLPGDRESLQDALFFRKVEYILRIPAGFSQSCLSGKNDVKLEKTSLPGSMSGFYLDFLLNRYVTTASIYAQKEAGLSEMQVSTLVSRDLAHHTPVVLQDFGKKNANGTAAYYICLVYAMIIIIFLGVTSIMLAFNDQDIRLRNLASPIKNLSLNLQILAGNMSFALIVGLLAVSLGFIITGQAAFDLNNRLLYANFMCLLLVCLSLSFVVGNLIGTRGTQQAVGNVLALGLSFVSGVFVQQALLGKTILHIASFTPTYWYVKAVNDIDRLLVGNSANLTPIYNSMLIQLGFAVAMVCVGMAIIKKKRFSG